MLIDYWYDQLSFQKNLIERTHFESIDSTHVYARTLADAYVENTWKLVTANLQTAGIAQRERQWSSPGSVNIYVTYMIPFPSSKMPLLFNISQVTTIAVARVLEKLGFSPQIKWVNDLLLNHKKVCGVLCENRGTLISSPDLLILIVSVGLNVNMKESEGLGQPVTSLYLETGKEYDRDMIIELLNESLFTTFQTFVLHGFMPLVQSLKNQLIHLGKRIIVEDEGREFEGLFEDITDRGTMLLNIDGKIQERVTGRIIRTF